MLDALKVAGLEAGLCSAPTVLVYCTHAWFPRWPDRNGSYGFGTSPQYAIRSDYGRHTLERCVEIAKKRASNMMAHGNYNG